MVDIIICVYNALESTKRCLKSVLKYSNYNKIFIIDDCSDFVTSDWLLSYCITEQGRNVKLIRNRDNIGYTKSANIGLKESESKYVILLNSDTIVAPMWVEKLIRCYDTYPRTGIVGPISNNAGWQTVKTKKFDTDIINNSLDKITPSYPKVNFVNGFCYVMKKEVIESIGYFDEESFPVGYGEEDDFSIRAKDAGYDLRIVDDLLIYHEKSMSFDSVDIKELKDKGYKQLCSKYTKKRINQLLYQININSDLRRSKREVEKILKE